jgi:hypothetical protein
MAPDDGGTVLSMVPEEVKPTEGTHAPPLQVPPEHDPVVKVRTTPVVELHVSVTHGFPVASAIGVVLQPPF